ncbi:MAG: UDP-N-acetylglucosamine 1-carboxyvinyltransferase [Nitrospinae bacterium]|nr:UDP-N-acetylglucosamine 1-carboxyvinyltransferase [Nitrospinota bacterium]
MDKIVIEGGRRLEGEIKIAGAKNAALPAFAATLLCPGKFVFSNVPDLRDMDTMIALLKVMDAVVEKHDGGVVTVNTENIVHCEAPYDLVRTMRASCLVLGPLLARLGKSRLSLPGGCAIGERPINLHLKGFQSLGAEISLEEGYVNAAAPDGLTGQRVYFDLVTVTGTENLMMAATGAKGTTVLENAAREPEVVFLADMLNKMGADVRGAGTDKITINGGKELKPAEIAIIPDRVETGTFMAVSAITGGFLKIVGCHPPHVEAVTLKFIEMGCKISEGPDWLEVTGPARPRPADVETNPYPSFPTDMQAQAMAVLAVADGASVVTESIFENRYMHVAEMRRMGANILIKGKNAFIHGVPSLSGAQVMATDLRASASLIVAGLAAKGKTHVRRVYHLDRGYERIEEKLRKVGAKITRQPDKDKK